MKKTIILNCGHPDCKEMGMFEYKNKIERDTIYKQYGNGNWLCCRHNDEDKLLSVTNTKIITILTVGKSKRYPRLKKLYFDNGFGFVYGNGYKVYADDFPEGTKLIETAEIILPKNNKQ